ncbi:hypothetical protein ACVIRO_001274 [Rhizobium ruizarguesonis]|jgi:hypothetical protein
MTHAQLVSQIAVNHLTPQCRKLYKHLQSRKAHGVSQMEAMLLLRIAALPRRISDLEEAGIEISRERKVDETGHAYVRYSLAA